MVFKFLFKTIWVNVLETLIKMLIIFLEQNIFSLSLYSIDLNISLETLQTTNLQKEKNILYSNFKLYFIFSVVMSFIKYINNNFLLIRYFSKNSVFSTCSEWLKRRGVSPKICWLGKIKKLFYFMIFCFLVVRIFKTENWRVFYLINSYFT